MPTLAEIKTQVRQRADMVHSDFVSDSELTGYINLSYFELYDLLITAYGENYFVAAPDTFNTVNGTAQYALPDDLYKLLGVDLRLSNGQFRTLKQFNFGDRNRRPLNNLVGPYTEELRYRLNGSDLWLAPTPTSVQTIQVWYAPTLPPLTDDDDVLVSVSGWEEYVIVDAAIKCLNKEESDVSVLMASKQALATRIREAAANRDEAEPSTVRDIYCDYDSEWL